LSLIQLTQRASPSNIDEIFVFKEEQRDVIALLERLNREPGHYFNTSAEFANICVYLKTFSVFTKTQKVAAIGSGDARFKERVIDLRGEPFLADDNRTWPRVSQSVLR
jgi:hypothetical protein